MLQSVEYEMRFPIPSLPQLFQYGTITNMYLWDYDKKLLKKTKAGRLLILERMINYGPEKDEKIKLSEVKKNWDKLDLFPVRKRLLELLIWGKYKSSLKNNKLFWMR